MASPTATDVAKALLRDLGVMSLSPSVPAGQIVPIERGDIEDVVFVMNEAMQGLWKREPAELKQQPGSFYLHAPTTVTLTATSGSKVISSFATWASWMEGCTIRIAGDSQDNELLSATLLAREYVGTTGSAKSSIVYADSATLDETIQQVMEPLAVYAPSGFWPLSMATDHYQFARLANFPMVADGFGRAISFSSAFYLFTNKSSADRPCVWIQDGYYDPTLAYVKKRVRFAPMPTSVATVGYIALMNAPRIAVTDVQDSSYKVLPIVDGAVESIYMPICRQLLTKLSTFKNEAGKAEIARAFKQAQNDVINSTGAIGDSYFRYPGR